MNQSVVAANQVHLVNAPLYHIVDYFFGVKLGFRNSKVTSPVVVNGLDHFRSKLNDIFCVVASERESHPLDWLYPIDLFQQEDYSSDDVIDSGSNFSQANYICSHFGSIEVLCRSWARTHKFFLTLHTLACFKDTVLNDELPRFH